MLGAKKQLDAEDRVFENVQALTLPCVSPLHAIPGFERVSKRKIFEKGAVLFAEGHSACDVHVVCTGRLKLSMTSAEGRKLIVRIARPGDLLGIHAALTGRSYEATAEALTPCRIDYISRKDLFGLLERQKSFGLSVAVAISKDFTDFLEHARGLLLSISAAEKLARLLLSLADQFGRRTTNGIILQTMLTHEEIAQVIGASRETVTRSLNVFKRKRVIRAAEGEVVILNRAALAELAGQGQRSFSEFV
jgi:CRP/FNR family transcriptional regulator